MLRLQPNGDRHNLKAHKHADERVYKHELKFSWIIVKIDYLSVENSELVSNLYQVHKNINYLDVLDRCYQIDYNRGINHHYNRVDVRRRLVF